MKSLTIPKHQVVIAGYPCPCCGSREKVGIEDVNIYDMTLSLCNNCGLIYRDTYLSPECYYEYITKFQKKVPNFNYLLGEKLKSSIITNHLKIKPLSTVLDLFCGTANALDELSITHGKRLMYGSEPTEAFYKYAKAETQATIFQGVLPPKTATYDYIFLFDRLHQIPAPDIFLQEIKSRLNAGGTLLLTVPVLDGVSARLYLEKFPLHYVTFFSQATIQNLLISQGFVINKIYKHFRDVILVCSIGDKLPITNTFNESIKFLEKMDRLSKVLQKKVLDPMALCEKYPEFIEFWIMSAQGKAQDQNFIAGLMGKLEENFAGYYEAELSLGSFCYQRQMFGEAIDHLERVTQICVSYDCEFMLSQCYYSLQDYQKAIDHLKIAMKIFPQKTENIDLLAAIYNKLP